MRVRPALSMWGRSAENQHSGGRGKGRRSRAGGGGAGEEAVVVVISGGRRTSDARVPPRADYRRIIAVNSRTSSSVPIEHDTQAIPVRPRLRAAVWRGVIRFSTDPEGIAGIRYVSKLVVALRLSVSCPAVGLPLRQEDPSAVLPPVVKARPIIPHRHGISGQVKLHCGKLCCVCVGPVDRG